MPSNRHAIPAGLGGQVDDETVGLQVFQFGFGEDDGRNGVDNQIIAAQPAGQVAKLFRAKAHGLCPGQLVVFSGGNADLCPKSSEALRGNSSYPAKTNDQHAGSMYGDGQMFHCQLDSALCRWDSIGHRQLLTGKVIVECQSSFLSHRLRFRVDAPATEKLPRRQPVQNRGQRLLGYGQGRVEQTSAECNG